MHHIPNALSFFRILLIPVLVYQVLQGTMLSAAITLIISGLTDLLDGFLARRFNWVSKLGKMLDPAADKLTQITVCVLFAFIFGTRFWFFFAFLIFKELVMLVLGFYLLKKGANIEGARWFGKMTTALFYFSMILFALIPPLPYSVKYTLLAAMCISALITGLCYIPSFSAYKRQSKMMKSPPQ